MFRVNELLKCTCGYLASVGSEDAIKGISIDSRTIKKGEAFIAIRGNNFDGHNFIEEAIKKGAFCVIKESRVNPVRMRYGTERVFVIEVKDTIKALGDIARYQRSKFNIPVIAITGSNGKTTTKEMTAWLLSQRFSILKNAGTRNNHIGVPLTLLNLNRKHDLAVLELGTNHFGEIDYLARICLPNIGVITNIGPAHLEHFSNLEGILREKYSLTDNLKEPYLAIINSDDRLLAARTSSALRKTFVLNFAVKRKAEFSASKVIFLNNRFEFIVNKKHKFVLKTPGQHNIYNALAAIAIARIFGIGYKEAARQLAAFDFPSGRLKPQKLGEINFIDDTYNSNPLSLEEALNALANLKIKGRKILVMGDMLELGSQEEAYHSRIGKKVNRVCEVFITVGKLSELSASVARAGGFNPKNIFTCASVRQARDVLLNKVYARPDDLVLVKGSRAMNMEEIFKNS